MSDDYLWDGSGEPDPEVQRLESVLGSFRHNRPAPHFPEQGKSRWRLPWALALRPYAWPRLAAVTALALVVIGAWLLLRRPKASQPAWEVASLAGEPRIGRNRIDHTGRLAIGQWLETDGSSQARISVGTIGQVQVEPNTRLRLVEARLTEHRLALERGTIHALIWAPPGDFVVDTPSAAAVDLGCAYTLQVDEKGAGLVRVTFGWVGFKLAGRESFIPAGALCATRPGVGPGTPYFEDVAPAFRAALDKLDFESSTPKARAAALATVLAQSRKRDALTLWHLLSRTSQPERGRVYDRLAALVPPPSQVTRQGVLRGDKQMLDLWWNQLGLGDTSWWRLWERSWPQPSR